MNHNFYFENSLYYSYEHFREKSIYKKYIKHSQIKNLIETLREKNTFQIGKIGESFDKKEIFLIKIGTGNKKIFLWSQMHGDEPTATAAFFDIFNFFSDTIYFNDIKNLILNNCTIYFIPMLNPDGADNFTRRNSMAIDLNRDAISLQAPESQILMKVFDLIQPDFCFNLHDQSNKYSVGNSFKQATISFLAPSFDYQKSVNSVRLKSMKVISLLYELLNNFIPGHISRYSDDYEIRAFGETFQKKGASTILVESGGWKNDTEKQFVRKLNFILILSAFKIISEDFYDNCSENIYYSIPLNQENLFDLLLRNISILNNSFKYKIDIGINFDEIYIKNKFKSFLKAKIENIGDLSIFYGIDDYDLSGYYLEEGKTFSKVFNKIEELYNLNFIKLMQKGYTNLIILNTKNEISGIPFNILTTKSNPDFSIKIGNNPTFVFKKENKIDYLLINGFIQNLITNTFQSGGLKY